MKRWWIRRGKDELWRNSGVGCSAVWPALRKCASDPVFCGCGAFGDELLCELAEFGVGLGVEELYLVW